MVDLFGENVTSEVGLSACGNLAATETRHQSRLHDPFQLRGPTVVDGVVVGGVAGMSLGLTG